MAELTDVVNCLFKDRHNYKNLSSEDKDKYFFIINRLLSRKYPHKAQELNNKDIDKGLALDVWFIHLKDEVDKYPKWLWSKAKSKNTSGIKESDINLLCQEFDISRTDIDNIAIWYPDMIKQYVKDKTK